ncbi:MULTISPECIES: hypothetical protein [Burkholderia]|uniref:hypothetical protein n=1 Tax=Burkholderia TaxID=32008 RepID=UPI00163A1083|nr:MULTISPECIES: hypothetical protein [Burkholderia]MBN3501988.1 hypothetical protein [Burkholderia cenocepacia]MCA8007937.1 hypothetical protein [Burkholderia cenocepacia]MCO1393877.1 hypothetical protein [Burkholderia cenocepacia]MCO1405307.1 hypothetical protein [Burkholderia cenocepacia]MCW5116006.1 hypothetical protein [Burkholderia cenocepacia]
MTSSSGVAGGGWSRRWRFRADYFELSVIIPRIPEFRVRMQNMHADTAIRNGYASLPHGARAI